MNTMYNNRTGERYVLGPKTAAIQPQSDGWKLHCTVTHAEFLRMSGADVHDYRQFAESSIKSGFPVSRRFGDYVATFEKDEIRYELLIRDPVVNTAGLPTTGYTNIPIGYNCDLLTDRSLDETPFPVEEK